MSDQNFSTWDGFESEFFENQGGMSLFETQPASHVTSTIAEHRQILNILFIIDVSGSMRGKRIAQVNYAMENIVKELRNRDDINSAIRIGIMEFGENATWVTPLPMPIENYVFTQFEANPCVTNYGKAFEALNMKLRRGGFMNPSFGEFFAPIILFVTDGEPLDIHEYPIALRDLKKNGWFRKSMRYAIAVGNDARSQEVLRVLTEFTDMPENVRYADEGDALCNLIQFIAIRASEVQTSMVSMPNSSGDSYPSTHSYNGNSIFSDTDDTFFLNMF